ncbi:MAG TPA: integrase [Chloroflexota bacterium]|nr:integrase [Chloroflexota bacterium]
MPKWPAHDEEMTVDERRKYLKRMQGRYWAADRRGRGSFLDEMKAVTGLHRRSLVRLLSPAGEGLARKSRTKQRGRTYGVAVEEVIRVVWESLDYVCAERLQPALVETAQQLARHGEVRLTAAVVAQLGQISRASVQRRLTHFVQLGLFNLDAPRLPKKGPERANATNAVARVIPMQKIAWNEAEPGHFEVDLVHHSGPSASGEYVHTLQLVDVATGWSERVAVLGRSQRAMEAAFRRVVERVPFPIRELHPDNGSEFLNDHLVRYWGETITGLTLSRSRPYQKNDNRFVEQKNDTLVRAYLGHGRLDTPEQCAALNALYDQMWLYYNGFQPVLHLVEKTVTEGRLRRTWDRAQTPLARLCATGILSAERHAALEHLRDQTNPRALRRQLYADIEQVQRLPTLASRLSVPPPRALTADGATVTLMPPESTTRNVTVEVPAA